MELTLLIIITVIMVPMVLITNILLIVITYAGISKLIRQAKENRNL